MSTPYLEAAIAFFTRFVGETPLRLWGLAILVGCGLELVMKRAENGHSWRGYTRNCRHAIVYLSALFFLGPAIYRMAGYIRELIPFGPLVDLDLVSTETIAGQLFIGLLSLLLADFFIYWWHRAQHAVPALWDQHVVHHSPRELNIGAAFRVHWTEFMFQAVVISLPMLVLFKISPDGMGVIGTALGIWVYLIHANIRLYLGPFARVVTGPQQHRIHHSILRAHHDKNFAAYFPIWDIVFGTYHHPKRDEYPPTGVEGVFIETTTLMSVYPFVAWGKRLLAWRRHQPSRTIDDRR